MYDRIPSPGKENRVSITQDNGQVITGVLAYADDATQEGSAYTKGNVLPDDVCMLMDLDPDPSEPDDAFRYLGLMDAEVYGGIAIRVSSKGVPLAGISFSVSGTGMVTTDAQGRVFLKKPPGSYTANFTSTLDLAFSPSSLQVVSKAGVINYYEVEAREASITEKVFTSSTTITFSDRVSEIDVFCVGAGGSGGVAFSNRNVFGAVSGGAGGYTSTKKGVKYSGESISVNIGAGGSPVSLVKTDFSYGESEINGNSGGRTYVSMGPSTICKADGGAGGYADSNNVNTGAKGANGGSGSGAASRSSAGRSGQNGSSGDNAGSIVGGTGQGTTTRAFGEGSGTAYSPAGESAVASVNKSTGAFFTDKGGADSGAGRARTSTTTSTSGSSTATSGSTKGAGGGGAVIATSSTVSSGLNHRAKSGAGTDGLVIIRWRYK